MHSCTHHRFAASYLSVSPLPPLFRPSLASQKRVGFFVSDRSTQTEESDILEVKRITHVIETLIQVWGILPCCYCSSSPWLPQACSWPSAHKGIQDHVELLFLISDFQLRIQCVKKSLFPPSKSYDLSGARYMYLEGPKSFFSTPNKAPFDDLLTGALIKAFRVPG